MKVIKKPSNHMHCTRHLTIIISFVILFSIFSSLIVPAISAKTEPVTLTKDDSSDTKTISDKTLSPTTVTSTKDTTSVQDTTTQTDSKETTDNTQDSTPTKDTSSEPDTTSTQTDTTNSEPITKTSTEPQTTTTQIDNIDTTDPTEDSLSNQDTSTISTISSVKKITTDNTVQLSDNSLNSTINNSAQQINTSLNETNIKENTIVKKYNFTTVNDSSDENTIKHYSSSIGNISINETVSVYIVDESNKQEISSVQCQKTKIEKVEFKAAESKGNVELSVKNLKEIPDEVNENMNLTNESEVYEYLDIKLTSNDEYIGETGIQTMSFIFTVTKDWIENDNIDIHSVKMMRYHNDSWQVLNTSYVNESDSEIRFRAITPGLSVFAVVGDKVVEDSDEIIVETNNMPLWMPFSVILASTATLGIFLFKKRFVYNP